MDGYIQKPITYSTLPSEEERSNWTEKNYVELIKLHPELYRDLPVHFKEMKSIIKVAIKGDSRNLWYVPDEAAEKLSISKGKQLPFVVRGRVLNIPEETKENDVDIVQRDNDLLLLDDPCESFVRTVYYISDLHIEHQIDIEQKSLEEIIKKIRLKIKELIDSFVTDNGIVIFAGDIADSPEIARLFYKEFISAMLRAGLYCSPAIDNKFWRVIAIAGNHELWDADPCGIFPVRSPERVIEDIRVRRVEFAQNQLIYDIKGSFAQKLDESKLLSMPDSELRALILESSFTLLGGVGFTGNNKRFNAEAEVYGVRALENGVLTSRISLQEDIEQSKRFLALHNKLVRCASDLPLIVLTHTPISDWSNEKPNPGWIYIYGHTHRNQLIRTKEGINIFADNQIGYKPKKWSFKSFTRRCLFDPFNEWNDGIYKITPQQYRDFSYGRGIKMKFTSKDMVTMLKREGIYMFFQETPRGLRMLIGAQKRVVDHDISYYYDNLGKYKRYIAQAFEPFQSALKEISKEVKAFGGLGIIHGCIVDVDWYSHIFLNPFDGKISAYVAEDMVNKMVFPDIQTMLIGTPFELRYRKAIDSGKINILSKKNSAGEALAKVPEVFLDTTMYTLSRTALSVQYLINKGVVRIWNDEVLGVNKIKDKLLLEKKRHSKKPKSISAAKSKPMSPEEALRKRAERYAAKVLDRSANKVEVVLDSYKGGKDPVKASCKVCGYTWTKRADRLLERCYCPICRKTAK